MRVLLLIPRLLPLDLTVFRLPHRIKYIFLQLILCRLKLQLLEFIQCNIHRLFFGDVAVLSVQSKDAVKVLEVGVLHIMGRLTILETDEFWVVDLAQDEALVEFSKFHHRINIVFGGSLLTRFNVIKCSN
jgi:hypothetical protein